MYIYFSHCLQYYLKHKILTHTLYLIFYCKFCAKNLQHHIYWWYNFHLKVIKYLNFSLTICWHSSDTYVLDAMLSSKSMIDDFMYWHLSPCVNLTFTSCIFTISITRSWTDNDEGAIDCTNRSISASFNESPPYCTRQDYVVTLVVNCNFHKRHKSHDGQVFVSWSQCKFSFQYMRCMTGFITRRCFAEKSNIYIYI